MDMKQKKIWILLLTFVTVFLCNTVAISQTLEDGPDPPPAPIDGTTYISIIVALLFIVVFFFLKKKNKLQDN